MTTPPRVAVIGAGYLGTFHARKYAASANCSLVGIADTDADRLADLCTELDVPGETDYRRLLPRVDAVSIVVPTAAHYEVTRDALEAGCHVLVEKPFTSSEEEASDLIARAQRSGRIIQIGLLERFNAAFAALMDMREEPRFIEVHRLAPWKDRGAAVDVTLDLMIHDIDLVLTVVGEEPRDIRASGTAVVGDTLDIVNARVEFPGGCVANVTASRLSTRSERKMRVFQPRCCVTLDLLRHRLDRYEVDDEASGTIHHKERDFSKSDSLQQEIEHFLDCIVRSARPLVAGEDGLRALRTALEITRLMRPGA